MGVVNHSVNTQTWTVLRHEKAKFAHKKKKYLKQFVLFAMELE